MEKWKTLKMVKSKFDTKLLNKIYYLIPIIFLSACSFFQKQSIHVYPNNWTGKKIYFVGLDDKYKKTDSFNSIWSKLHKTKFRPYHKFQNKPYTIIGTFESWENDFIIIEDKKNRRYKMVFDFGRDESSSFPSYILFEDVLNEAKAMIGKTIWLNNTLDFKGFYSYADYDFNRFEPVEVVDINPYQNRDSDYPIWLKIKAKNGLEGFVRFNGDEGRVGIQDHYYTSEPLPRLWGKERIAQIIQREIELGMTDRQVRLSIGNPHELNHTSSRHGVAEQWVYGAEMGERVYYQFSNGKLMFINQ